MNMDAREMKKAEELVKKLVKEHKGTLEFLSKH